MNKKTFNNNNKSLFQNKTIFNNKENNKQSLNYLPKPKYPKTQNFNKNNSWNHKKKNNPFINNKDSFITGKPRFNNFENKHKNKFKNKHNNKFFTKNKFNKYNKKKKIEKKAYKLYNIVLSASMHNTIIGLFDATTGNLIKSVSAGLLGFKKHKRSSFIARESCAIDFINFVKQHVDIKNTCVKIVLKGLGPGRYSFLKRIKTLKPVSVVGIEDHTPIPFNGVRAKKQRRL